MLLRAHGRAVGMPSDDDMGNSEVGHNALGSGQVYAQGAALVSDAIASGSLFEGAAWQEVVANAAREGATLHLIGLLSVVSEFGIGVTSSGPTGADVVSPQPRS